MAKYIHCSQCVQLASKWSAAVFVQYSPLTFGLTPYSLPLKQWFIKCFYDAFIANIYVIHGHRALHWAPCSPPLLLLAVQYSLDHRKHFHKVFLTDLCHKSWPGNIWYTAYFICLWRINIPLLQSDTFLIFDVFISLISKSLVSFQVRNPTMNTNL